VLKTLFVSLRDVVAGHSWDRAAVSSCWPSDPRDVYRQMAKAGFSATDYRNAYPDLVANLPSDEWAPKFFLRFLEDESAWIRIFPIRTNFRELARLADMPMREATRAGLVRNIIQSQIDCDEVAQCEPAWWTAALKTIVGRGAPVVVMGDSHSRIFRQTILEPDRRIMPLNLAFGGGSAIGMSRPASRSGYGARLTRAAKAIESAAAANGIEVPICLCLGQVDVEFVYTFRCLRDNSLKLNQSGFEAFCEEVAAAYVGWIRSLALERPMIFGINPPCVRDEMLVRAYNIQMRAYQGANIIDESGFDGIISRLPSMDLPDQRLRTENHRLFNRVLADAAHSNGIAYADDFDQLIGPDGLLQPCFSSSFVGNDIHVGGDQARRSKKDFLVRSVSDCAKDPGARPTSDDGRRAGMR
jgi:hypothetical protein